MLSKYLNSIKNTKFLRRFSAAVLSLSLFALSSIPAEARQHHKVVRKASSKRAVKTRVAKAAPKRTVRTRVAKASPQRVVRARVAKAAPQRVVRARVAKAAPQRAVRARVVKAAPQRAVRAPVAKAAPTAAEIRQQRAEQARQQQAQQALQLAAQAEQARQRREAAWQAGEPLRQQQRNAWAAAEAPFLTHNFDAQIIVPRMTQDSRNLALPMLPINFTHVDIGYGLNPARTAQYGLGLPAAPVIHPYHMDQDIKGYATPAFLLNAKLPQYNPDFGPVALHRNLSGVNPANIESFLIVQTMPWYADNPQHLLQLKPQYWLNPHAPYQDPQPHNEGFQVSVGVFGGPRIQGQFGDTLIENHALSIHNGGPHPELISSGSTLNIAPLNTDVSQTFFSLTKHGGRAAIVQHVLLNNADGEEFSRNLAASHDLTDVVTEFRNSKLLNHRYATIDPDEVF